MARNEDGEFELILGNRQLLSVFFLVVVLLGLCFLIGYVFGRNSAPVLNAETAAPAEESREPLVVTPPERDAETGGAKAETPQPASAEPAKQPTPQQTAPQQTAPQQTSKAAPPPAPKQPTPAAKAAPPASSSQPIPGRTYLQLSATSRDQAEAMVDLLRSRNFTALAAQIPEKPDTYRVLVGPLDDSAVGRTRSELKAANFPADDAYVRKY